MNKQSLPPTVSARTLAEISTLSERRVRQLASEKRLVRNKAGRFPTRDNLVLLMQHFKEFSSEYSRERTGKLRAQRLLAERQLERSDFGNDKPDGTRGDFRAHLPQ